MTDITHLLAYEEGFRSFVYIDSEGYPTIGIGMLLGPKCTEKEAKRLYTFEMPFAAAQMWVKCKVNTIYNQCYDNPVIRPALLATEAQGLSPYENPRTAVLLSMAYQMGVDGLAKFKNTLGNIADKHWEFAAAGMLKSKWAQQTPKRAKRHADQLKSGVWAEEY